jgi:mRNA interferase MazF
LKRGDLITVVVAGDHGKPRPAVVIQADRLQSAATVLVCLFTGDAEKISDTRLLVEPDETNGLRKKSLIQAEKIYPIPRSKCGARIGALSAEQVAELNILLTFVLGLGD